MVTTPNPVDVHVGSRIRLRRKLLGMSQSKLGDAIGLTFQQVQKYERGTTRVGSGRLFQLSKVLNVPLSFFFDDMPAKIAGPKGHPQEASEPFADNPLTKPETLELVRAYHRLPTAAVRKCMRELVKSLANLSNPN
jgi:transcriptional regulator with XRE-family HTH domain